MPCRIFQFILASLSKDSSDVKGFAKDLSWQPIFSSGVRVGRVALHTSFRSFRNTGSRCVFCKRSHVVDSTVPLGWERCSRLSIHVVLVAVVVDVVVVVVVVDAIGAVLTRGICVSLRSYVVSTKLSANRLPQDLLPPRTAATCE